MIQAGTRNSVFAQCSMPNRMHFSHQGFLQSAIPLVGVELSTECQIPYDCGLGIGVIVLAWGAISWYRNLEELLSCYIAMVQLDCLLFQRVHRSRLAHVWGNPTQAFWTNRQNFPWQKGCPQRRSRACTGSVQERAKHSAMSTLTYWGQHQGHVVWNQARIYSGSLK